MTETELAAFKAGVEAMRAAAVKLCQSHSAPVFNFGAVYLPSMTMLTASLLSEEIGKLQVEAPK